MPGAQQRLARAIAARSRSRSKEPFGLGHQVTDGLSDYAWGRITAATLSFRILGSENTMVSLVALATLALMDQAALGDGVSQWHADGQDDGRWFVEMTIAVGV